MHDYFDIIGVSRHAPADEIRRASARRAWKWHPDFDGYVGVLPSRGPSGARAAGLHGLAEIAIDFVDMSEIVDRMQVAFFDQARNTREGL